MKKNLFLKFFVLVVMGLFTITACQNDDVTAPKTEDEIDIQAIISQLNAVKADLENVTANRITAAKKEFDVLKQHFEVNPDNESLQAKIIAKAVHIEALTAFQTRAIGNYPTSPTVPDPLGGGGNVTRNDYNRIITYLNSLNTYLSQLKTYIENNIDGSSEDLTQRVTTLESTINSLSTIYATKTELNSAVSTLNTTISTLGGKLEGKIDILNTLLGITEEDPNASSVLDDIRGQLTSLNSLKADKFTIEATVYNLKTVYDELIGITKALNDRLTKAEEDIADLQERVAYIEEVEIPEIWNAISFLYDYIGGVYDNLDQRVNSITFKSEYDLGPSMSSIILVRALSEWAPLNATDGFGWQKDEEGFPYPAITWLTYNISPANAHVDTETIELVYTNTTIITRSTEDEPLLKIADSELIEYENGVLRVPVLIHNAALKTSFDPESKKNIKVALKLTNEGYTAGEEPTRPEKEVALKAAADEDRSVVSSEYVTVWFGLFNGHVAMVDGEKTDRVGDILPPEIDPDDFVTNEPEEVTPLLKLKAGESKTLNLPDYLLGVFYDEFEKEFRLPADYLFEDLTLTYKLADLGVTNDGSGFVTLTTEGKLSLTDDNDQAAIGKTVAILIQMVDSDGLVRGSGYLKIVIEGQPKDAPIVINDVLGGLGFNFNVTDCAEQTNIFSPDYINSLVQDGILSNSDVNISSLGLFYQEYTEIEVDWEKSTYPEGALQSHITLSFADNSGVKYIKGTISNKAPFGAYTIATVIKSKGYRPDIQVKWSFVAQQPVLKNGISVVGNKVVVNATEPQEVPLSAAIYELILNDLFNQLEGGDFDYDNLVGYCKDFVKTSFVFTSVPAGYSIVDNGKSIQKTGLSIVARIEEVKGKTRLQLTETQSVFDLIGKEGIKVTAKGEINDRQLNVSDPVEIYFAHPLKINSPGDSFVNNSFVLDLYGDNSVIADWNENLLGNLDNSWFMNHYGIDWKYDTSIRYRGDALFSPLKFKLDQATVTGVSNPLLVKVAFDTVLSQDFVTREGTRTPIRVRFKLMNYTGGSLSGETVSIPIEIKHRWGTTTDNLKIKID